MFFENSSVSRCPPPVISFLSFDYTTPDYILRIIKGQFLFSFFTFRKEIYVKENLQYNKFSILWSSTTYISYIARFVTFMTFHRWMIKEILRIFNYIAIVKSWTPQCMIRRELFYFIVPTCFKEQSGSHVSSLGSQSVTISFFGRHLLLLVLRKIPKFQNFQFLDTVECKNFWVGQNFHFFFIFLPNVKGWLFTISNMARPQV